jgi:hypothetical protein
MLKYLFLVAMLAVSAVAVSACSAGLDPDGMHFKVGHDQQHG